MLPVADGVDTHTHPIALLGGRDRLHRRAEISHIQLLAQILRQGCTQEVHRQALALLAQIHSHLAAAKADHNPAGAITATAKVDATNRCCIGGSCLALEYRSHGRRCSRGRCRSTGGIKQDQQRVSLALQAVGRSRLQVQYQTRATRCLHQIHRAQIALVEFQQGLAGAIAHARKIQRDTRRRLHDKSGRIGCQRLGHLDTDDLGA